MYHLTSLTVLSLICLCSANPARFTQVNGTQQHGSVANPLEVGLSGLGQPGSAASGSENGNDTMEFDFVNLPGYGVVDDANSTVNGSFSCYERRYGYYADISRNCQMFHLCYPVREPSSQAIVYQRFSFVCSDNAFFDQAHLVCVENETSIACEDSESYYEPSNDRLMESLQASQPGMFTLEEDDGSASNGTASGSSVDGSSDAMTAAASEQAASIYNFYNDWF